MAGSSLLTLIDDIATLLDDVAVMSKVAMKKTAGMLGDDLALNAEQVTGVKPDRELPVVWAVALGSLKNKAILVPAALLISFFAPALITPLLMIGGGYLCFEGFEKVFHKLFHAQHDHGDHSANHSADQHGKDAGRAAQRVRLKALADPSIDLVAFEKEKIRGAIRTDFILSAEIIVISLGTLEDKAFGLQVAVLIAVALLITVGVYGLVATIVKLDDVGLYLTKPGENPSATSFKRSLGTAILVATPYLMRGLGIAGTVAMFLVGGGIILHGLEENVHSIAEFAHHLEEAAGKVAGILGTLTPTVLGGLTGVLTGGVLMAIYSGIKKLTKS